nr:MAG TPA: hypothetical protein [Caudoviricetes sp.]
MITFKSNLYIQYILYIVVFQVEGGCLNVIIT